MADNNPSPKGVSGPSPKSGPRRNLSSAPGKAGGRSRYASRACQECRRRRVKCDGDKPSCSRCLDRQLSCIYTTDDDGRGTAPKAYVRQLQARINILERILWLHSIDVDASAAQLLAQDVVPNTTSLTTGGSSAFDQLCTAFEGTLYLDDYLNFDSDGEARYFGSASGRTAFQGCNASLEHPNLERHIEAPNMYTQAISNGARIPEELESHLLELYFTWQGPFCQVVDEALFRESKANNGRYFSPLLLNCILASASRYSDRVEVRSDPQDSNTAGRAFLEMAEALLYLDLRRPNITTLQSLAVLGTAYVAFGHDAAGWLCQGMANRLVLDMGLHLDSNILNSPNRITEAEAELRRQIYWSLYCDDKLAASYTGRVCTMLDFQGVVGLPSLPSPTDQPDQRCTSTLVSQALLVHFQRSLIALSQILEKIHLNLYAPKRLAHGGQKRSFFDSCLLALKTWCYGLPPELKPVRSGTPNKFPQAYTLCMIYNTAIILLTKPYLADHGSRRSPSPQQPQQPLDSLAQKASTIQLEAAKQIGSLGEQYREVFGSFRKSPITATYCSLSAALALLNPYPQGAQDAGPGNIDMEKVNSCLKTLQELSESWVPAGKYHCSLVRMINGPDASGQQAPPGKVINAAPDEVYVPSWSQTYSQSTIVPPEGGWGQNGSGLDWSMWTNSGLANDGSLTSGGEIPGLFDLPSWLHEDIDSSINDLSWEQSL
ncbi:hypothetical protein BDV32DRAFT_158596 [Aspergillus pseudonomiae]|uniref:Uncharacterized protein n=1 Tax=Aspergillus pseudonomiae TaxID=1506151 RepID=A0A5N6I4F0_9EURO|nr:uncharacterized protein BDV37DRAFT_296771 [Aspergillus pseudonomiae]KAB8260927.1 hypothetical protein BDV32DRAFT_158596 [Aspergillus pseudonomiae]KAE8400577.1 hypothetical protein BDV37DRAFT_296771 [Aspergillus pseudonomiae]